MEGNRNKSEENKKNKLNKKKKRKENSTKKTPAIIGDKTVGNSDVWGGGLENRNQNLAREIIGSISTPPGAVKVYGPVELLRSR